ncbi:hypothetical protein KC19_4G084700, partial [Ceratodon purpureus]
CRRSCLNPHSAIGETNLKGDSSTSPLEACTGPGAGLVQRHLMLPAVANLDDENLERVCKVPAHVHQTLQTQAYGWELFTDHARLHTRKTLLVALARHSTQRRSMHGLNLTPNSPCRRSKQARRALKSLKSMLV